MTCRCSSWLGQVSIAGSAIATLQKELTSSSATARKITRPVKSPSPCRTVAAEMRAKPEPRPPPFKDSAEKYQSQFGAQLQAGEVDWDSQVCNPAQRVRSAWDKKTWCATADLFPERSDSFLSRCLKVASVHLADTFAWGCSLKALISPANLFSSATIRTNLQFVRSINQMDTSAENHSCSPEDELFILMDTKRPSSNTIRTMWMLKK